MGREEWKERSARRGRGKPSGPVGLWFNLERLFEKVQLSYRSHWSEVFPTLGLKTVYVSLFINILCFAVEAPSGSTQEGSRGS